MRRPNLKLRGGGLPLLPPSGNVHPEQQYIINLFPHGVMVVFPDHIMLGLFAPDGPDRTRLVFHFYLNGEAATDPDLAAERQALVDGWARVAIEDEDFVACVDANKHIRDELGIEMRFSPFWETTVHHFQKMVVEALSD